MESCHHVTFLTISGYTGPKRKLGPQYYTYYEGSNISYFTRATTDTSMHNKGNGLETDFVMECVCREKNRSILETGRQQDGGKTGGSWIQHCVL